MIREIAGEMFISIRTVKNHVNNILKNGRKKQQKKLGLFKR
ncbi:LuxR C-terminal-related transcriptional regulator [Aeribacillus composti]